MKKPLLSGFLLALFFGLTPVCAEPVKTYTDNTFLYSIDYPEKWRVKHISKAVFIVSPRESEEDDFSENVNIVAEDLEAVGRDVALIDYYRRGMSNATRMLHEFKSLEEAKTVWKDKEAIVTLYTMSDKGRTFKCKAYTFMTGKTAYVLTYTAMQGSFETYLPVAEKIIDSIQAAA